MKAVIQFCSEVPLHLERTALLKLNSLSWLPEKKHWREKKKERKKPIFQIKVIPTPLPWLQTSLSSFH